MQTPTAARATGQLLPAARRAAADFAAFIALEASCCIFPVAIFLILALSRAVHVPGLPRYDLILLLCLCVQALMVWSRLETADELKVICVFHVLGLALEAYKTTMGSWTYPEAAWSKIGAVPLYSGFMYASVASYMCQAWRRLRLELHGWSRSWPVGLTAAAIYVNFFTHHVMPDLRWWLAGLMSLLLIRCTVSFAVLGRRRRMPIVVAMLLIGLCVFGAENIATFLGAWQYPDQALGWHPVHGGKISSWSLLSVISFVVVAELKHAKGARGGQHPA